jgi:hypothetical protein
LVQTNLTMKKLMKQLLLLLMMLWHVLSVQTMLESSLFLLQLQNKILM